jgi:hypothetical protein
MNFFLGFWKMDQYGFQFMKNVKETVMVFFQFSKSIMIMWLKL